MDGVTDNTVLGVAFAVWAVVVGYGVRVLHALRGDVRMATRELHEYIVKTETRLAVLEDNVSRLNHKVDR